MALPKKKSRSITVEGKTYRYIVSKGQNLGGDVFPLNVTVQHQKGIGAKLTASGLTTRDFWLDISDSPRSSNEYLILTPRHIEKLIRLGVWRGWQPDDAGPPFKIDVRKEDINAGIGRI